MTTTLNNFHKINGKTMAGIIVLIIGAILLVDQLDLLFFPHWLFSWPMWIIAYGVYLGGKYNFKKPVWMWMVVIGTAFLLTENIDNAERFVWPVAIIGAGTYMVLKNNKRNEQYTEHNHYTEV